MASTEEIALVGYDASGKSTLIKVSLKIEKNKRKQATYLFPPNAGCLPKRKKWVF